MRGCRTVVAPRASGLTMVRGPSEQNGIAKEYNAADDEKGETVFKT